MPKRAQRVGKALIYYIHGVTSEDGRLFFYIHNSKGYSDVYRINIHEIIGIWLKKTTVGNYRNYIRLVRTFDRNATSVLACSEEMYWHILGLVRDYRRGVAHTRRIEIGITNSKLIW